MKKTVSILLALVMLLSAGIFCVPAFADDADAPVPEPEEAVSDDISPDEAPSEEPLSDEVPLEEVTPEEASPEEAGAERAAAGTDLVILYTNDIHCGVDENISFKGLADIKATLEAVGKQVVLVDCGDSVQGGSIGTLSKGRYVIDIMNKLGYVAATPGNHEFDYTMDGFFALVGRAKFPYVSANFVDKDGEAVLDPYVILEADGVRIAFVGVSTPQTLTSSKPSNFMNDKGEFIYGFCQDETGEAFYAAVQSAVDAARAEGADYVFALSHLGIFSVFSPYTSSDLITHTTGIDVVLDGHSHSVIEGDIVKNAAGENVILTSTGTKLENVGCLTIGADGSFSTTLINPGPAGKLIDEINEEFDELQNKVVAHTDVDLCITDPDTEALLIRSTETNLGDLCADAYRAISGADIAIVNGGGIRTNIPAGDITYGQIISVHPFGNELCVIEATGQEILDALELSVYKTPDIYGGFLQVSGITFTVDVSIPSSVKLDTNGMFASVGLKRRVKDVMVGDEPLDPKKTYTLASHNYNLKEKGDGYSMFADNTFLQDSVMLDNQVLINYIVDVLGGAVGEEYSDPYGQGRITVVGG